MKKLLFLFLLVGLFASVQAQSLFSKVSKDNFTIVNTNKITLKAVSTTLEQLNTWRLTYGVTATSINLKTGAMGYLSSAGVGISRVNFKLDDKGEPYQTWNVGSMLLFGNKEGNTLITTGGSVDIGILVAGGLGPVSLGPAYFINSQTLLLNLKIDFTF